jgi:extracellular factor (EF) 3-hydroxypalmitic acid methyl ester biosynthesis protein
VNQSISSETASFIVCQNNQGEVIRATLLKLTRYQAVFEVYKPDGIFQLSEVLSDFKIMMNDETVYAGRAVVSNLINTGFLIICEASLEDSWKKAEFLPSLQGSKGLQEGFSLAKKEWEDVNKVSSEFKVVVADMQMLFGNLRHWLDQIEATTQMDSGNFSEAERNVIQTLQGPILSTVTSSFKKFEQVAKNIHGPIEPFYRHYAKRLLHPWLLCSPFVERVFHKPLGYAGDYGMVNMILDDPLKGGSLYAKMMNLYFLRQLPAEAHRNRIKYLTEKLKEETGRVAQEGGVAKIFNVGCGPAKEVHNFITESDLCEKAQLTLLDFDEEVLHRTGDLLAEMKEVHGRKTNIQMIKKSVMQLLKEASQSNEDWQGDTYDFVYCAGLFDYLSDRICKRLMNLFYNLLAPGGLLVVTNVEASNPIRGMMELILDWHLIYRDANQLDSLVPDSVPLESSCVKSDPTGVNIFMEVRKPTDV